MTKPREPLPGMPASEWDALERDAVEGHKADEKTSYADQLAEFGEAKIREGLLGFFRGIYPDREPPKDTAELWYMVNNYQLEGDK